jgi:ANTAR domain
MDVMRVRAPSDAHAQRLLASLNGFTGRVESDGAAPIVALTLDTNTAARLVELFNALGTWLADGELATCQIDFGDRMYTLLAANPDEPNDPTGFLLERTIQLQVALDSRIVIEQAKGILAQRDGVTPEKAFEMIRREARSRRMKLRDLAAEVVSAAGSSSDAAVG